LVSHVGQGFSRTGCLSCRLKEEKTSKLCGIKEKKRNSYGLLEETPEEETQAKMGG
jgi:hypothetical protein